MLKKSLVVGGVLSLVLMWMPSCSSSPTCQGGEMCACYANDTCNSGLACRSNTCVNLDGTGASSSGGSSGTGVDSTACLACADKACSDEAAACKGSSGCEASLSCFLDCGTDAVCEANCAKGLSTDSGAKAVTYYSCAITSCVSDCVTVPSTGGSGNLGTGGNGSGVGGSSNPSGGTASHAGTGNIAGTTSTNTGGGGGTGVTPTTPTSGTNWLTLVEDGAPSGQGVNGALGVNGVLYAYNDGCATMNWDPISRCVSGDLCLASATSWGVAIGFDFNNSGATGTPPDTKHAWNATTAGVTGLAWQATGQTPAGLQVWVQNMDPMYMGSCSAMTCDINGPADGTASAGPSGQFSFSTMQKDYWGGTGISYVFNPADISALQFKIPGAIESDLTSYELCIDRIGVIR